MSKPEYLQIREGETLEDYHIRLFDKQDEYEIDRYTIAELLNDVAGTNYDESKWRKDYAQYKRWEKYILHKNLDHDRLQAYEEKRIEEQKERIRKQDQNREYNKLIRNSARFEKIQEDIYNAILDLEKVKPLPHHTDTFSVSGKGKHGMAVFSDWHFGIEVDTNHNRYNKDIFNRRVRRLVDKVIEYGMRNNISTLHIAQLGDLISGEIHTSVRVQNNEDLIEQIKYVSEVLAQVINELAYVFENIVYYNVIGNHARSGKKNEVGLKENFEYLVPWFLETRLRELTNVEIITDKDGYIETQVFDKDIALVHGNFDRVEQVVQRLPQMTGKLYDFIIGGHIHHHYEKEYGKTTVITNGSLIGNDDHSTQGRYGAKPSQKMLIFDKQEGLECEYIIKLDMIQ